MLTPSPGLVVAHLYLWARERQAGAVEGRKVRPALIVDVQQRSGGAAFVTACPITHSEIQSPGDGVELPQPVKHHLGLDEERSWMIATEVNRFTWPGYDLRRTADGREAYGNIPKPLLHAVLRLMLEHAREGNLDRIDRDD